MTFNGVREPPFGAAIVLSHLIISVIHIRSFCAPIDQPTHSFLLRARRRGELLRFGWHVVFASYASSVPGGVGVARHSSASG